MLRSAVALALLVVLMGVTGAREAREAHAGGLYVVDNSSDDGNVSSGCFDQVGDPPPGDCSLRAAITLANNDPTIKAIVFFLPAVIPIIEIHSPLPAITAPVIMEGASGGSTRININGSGPGFGGLFLRYHTGSTIKNMVINAFGGSGLGIQGGGGHTIVGNLIGMNNFSTGPLPNSSGIFMEETTGNIIGGIGPDRNVISGNTNHGIWIDLGANGNTIAGNIIGLSPDETTVIGNGSDGIISIINGSNRIGVPGTPNVIAGNGGNGVRIAGFGDNRLQTNFIGLNSQGQAKPNVGNGVLVGPSEGDPIIIGGSLENGNAISGNGASGVRIEAGAVVEVSGNTIGVSPNFGTALPNQGDGVQVVDTDALAAAGVPGAIEIGKPGARNLISGNAGDGIVLSGVENVSVRANEIGVNRDRTDGIPNGQNGITLFQAADNIIGGPSPLDGNFVTSHPGAGILVEGGDMGPAGVGGNSDDNEILNNFLGGIDDVPGNGVGIGIIADRTDIEGNTIVRNTFEGINIDGDSNRISGNFIGTTAQGDEGDEIEGNGGNGIAIFGNGNLIGPLVNFAAEPAGGQQFPIGTNLIWNNDGSGVFVLEGVENTIRQNSMRDNFAGAIDLAPEGPTPNDTDDPDTGANDRQNHPVLTFAAQSQLFAQGSHPSGGGGFLQGSLNSTPNSEFIIDVYEQPFCNEPANLQPAERWIGSFEVVTNQNGDAEFSLPAFSDMEPTAFVNATATDDLGSTSELSLCIQVSGTVPTPTPSPTQTPGPTGTPTPTPSPTDVDGDADCDGDVDMDDVIAVLSEVAGVPPGAPCENNVGCEDPIDDEDALDILLYVAAPADFPLPPC